MRAGNSYSIIIVVEMWDGRTSQDCPVHIPFLGKGRDISRPQHVDFN